MSMAIFNSFLYVHQSLHQHMGDLRLGLSNKDEHLSKKHGDSMGYE